MKCIRVEFGDLFNHAKDVKNSENQFYFISKDIEFKLVKTFILMTLSVKKMHCVLAKLAILFQFFGGDSDFPFSRISIW